MTSDWLSIRYRGYWDVPRIFLVKHVGQLYLFECLFDDDLDEYPDVYKVYSLPPLNDEEIPNDWTELPYRANRLLGSVPVAAVQFDTTRRAAIRPEVFELLGTTLPKPLHGQLAHAPSPQPVV